MVVRSRGRSSRPNPTTMCVNRPSNVGLIYLVHRLPQAPLGQHVLLRCRAGHQRALLRGLVAVSDGEGARQAERGSLRPVMRVQKYPTQRLRTWRRRHDHAAPALPGRGGRTNDATNAVVPSKGRTRRSGISVLLAAAAAGRSKRHRRRLLQLPRPPAGDGVPMMTSSRGGGLPPAAFRTTIAS